MNDGNYIEKALGRVIRDLRLQRKLSQEKLSELSNLDRSYISEIERGEKTASIRTLIKVSIGLDISIVELSEKLEKRINEN